MNTVNLLGVDFSGVMLSVLGIIGIIIAGGFLIFFLGDLLLSILDPQNSALKFNKNYKEKAEEKTFKEEKPQELSYISPNPTYREVDFKKAEQEENFLKNATATPTIMTYSEPFVVEKKTENENEKPVEDMFAKLRAEEELFKQEKLKAAITKENVFADVKKEKEEDINFDDIFFSDEEDYKLDDEEESEDLFLSDDIKDEDETDFVAPILPAEPKKEENQYEKLLAENLKLKNELEKLEKEKNEEIDKLSVLNVAADKKTSEKFDIYTKDEYYARLEELKERLKYNEKELRSVKKEYLPLRNVRKTLERDKKKLRRREALVAKQKIILYGVNNIADIDQAKAQKLEQDLDLLDGLRLSVQHCEDVIKNSEERYPILENSFKILSKNIEQIKNDINQIETKLKTIK